MRHSLVPFAALLLFFSGVSYSATEPSAEPQVESGIAYLSGGAGADARAELLPKVREYGLKLTFAGLPHREFLAEVTVRILDGAGKELLSAKSNGPFFFAKLPSGQYRITATFRGQTQERTVTVGEAKQTELPFYWQT